MLSRSSSIPWRSKETRLRVVRPASIFDISRMSLISASKCSPLRLIMARCCCCCAFNAASRSISWEKPRMAFIGVRISCDMLARNALLARLAASAASFGLPQFFISALPLRDVQKRHHRSNHNAISKLGIGPIFHGNASAVCPPEQFILDVDAFAFPASMRDRHASIGKSLPSWYFW